LEVLDVIQIHEKERQVPQHRVHEPLECLRSVLQAEWHAQELERPERRDHRCRRDIQRVDGYLVVSTDEVHFGKKSLSSQVGRKILDVRDWVAVRCL